MQSAEFLQHHDAEAIMRGTTIAITAVVAFALISFGRPVAAQDWPNAEMPSLGQTPSPVQIAEQPPPQPAEHCFLHARPAPACHFFGVTDFGLAFGPKPSWTRPPGADISVVPADQTEGANRIIGDWGVMRNIGSHDAIGIAWFATIDYLGETGPEVRYRRWLTDRQSLDFALGVPVAVSNPYPDTAVGPEGLILYLVRYNPVPGIGFAVRPEVVLRRIAYDCSTKPCVGITERTFRVLFGVEISEKPGAIVSGVLWGLIGLFSLGGCC